MLLELYHKIIPFKIYGFMVSSCGGKQASRLTPPYRSSTCTFCRCRTGRDRCGRSSSERGSGAWHFRMRPHWWSRAALPACARAHAEAQRSTACAACPPESDAPFPRTSDNPRSCTRPPGHAGHTRAGRYPRADDPSRRYDPSSGCPPRPAAPRARSRACPRRLP